MLRLVEERTGLPVHVEPDASLPPNLLAKTTMARGKMPFHRVACQPDRSASPDYLIVYECGFVLRHYAIPPQERVDFANTELAEQTVKQAVALQPDDQPTWVALGDSLRLMGEAKEAEMAYSRAITLNPHSNFDEAARQGSTQLA